MQNNRYVFRRRRRGGSNADHGMGISFGHWIGPTRKNTTTTISHGCPTATFWSWHGNANLPVRQRWQDVPTPRRCGLNPSQKSNPPCPQEATWCGNGMHGTIWFKTPMPLWRTMANLLRTHRIDVNYANVGGGGGPGSAESGDWMHANAVNYHPGLDQIAISSRRFNETWIIDHGITTEEASGPAGDLLYRYGNPEAYGRGTAEQRVLFGQHDVQWIPDGHPQAGKLMVFNNGNNRPDCTCSTIDVWTPPSWRTVPMTFPEKAPWVRMHLIGRIQKQPPKHSTAPTSVGFSPCPMATI